MTAPDNRNRSMGDCDIENASTESTNIDDHHAELKRRTIDGHPEEQLVRRAKAIVEERTKDWENANQQAEERIPRFRRDEIELGALLGKGGFFAVNDVRSIKLVAREDEEEDTSDLDHENHHHDEDYIQRVVQDRKFMQKYCIRNGHDCRYALKTMQEVCRWDCGMFINTVADLAIEFKFLAAVRHPNILKMRAVSEDIYSADAFLVLDKIYDTLEDRVGTWKKHNESGFSRLFDFQKKKEKEFMAKRLLVAYDIASALAYLHDVNIMYRDLKPSNVGFDVRDDAKLFDFGLATEFNPDKIRNPAYKLTGDTGTIRFMAPEVALCQPYTESADVYSFGILLWQICQLEAPFHKLSDEAVERKVIHLGARPKIDPHWPSAIRRLLQDCFASSPRRPPMSVVCTVLRHEISQLTPKELVDEDDLMDSTRSAMSLRYISA
eukprot:Nitzschia sp. Nitz4//scaffold161_size51353//37634//39263//NITZ4_006955-RA/size51353-augustus-gene-0.48-mRNA-1//1//CDS//3329537930//775//frame0